MLDWHETDPALGAPVAGPFRFSREGTRRRREAKLTYRTVVIVTCAFAVLAGWRSAGAAGAALGTAAALLLAFFAERLQGPYFVRVVPSLEVRENGLCFCDSARPVLFAELDGLLVGSSVIFLAFKKGAGSEKSTGASRRPWWERAIRQRAYWEIPLDGFAQPASVMRAIVDGSRLPAREISDEVCAAIQSRTAQSVARVPTPSGDLRF